MSESGAVTRIAPGGPSGFEPDDVLAKAEEGDEVYVEFEVHGESGIYGVVGVVKVRNDWEMEDGRTRGRKLHLDCDHNNINYLGLGLVLDPESDLTMVTDEIGIKWHGRDLRDDRELDKVHTIEVEKSE